MLHPRIVNRSCAQCEKWLFDDEHRLVTRLGAPVPRPAGAPTPCWSCPKKSPEQGGAFERELGRISRAISLYHQVRGSAGRCLSPAERRDAIVRRNLGILDSLLGAAEQDRLARILLSLITGPGAA